MTRFLLLFFFSISISLAFSQEKDTPRKGEGVYAFLKRNNRTEAKHFNEFIQLNKNKLGKSNSLILGTSYILPPLTVTEQPAPKPEPKPETAPKPEPKPEPEPAPKPEPANANTSTKNKTGINPLFGEKYKEYEIIDNSLAGACFFIVSGHGGPDPGAIAKVAGHELHEDEYAYDIALRLARRLLQYGATVHVIIQDPKDGIRDGKYLNNSKNETCMGKPIPLSQMERLKQRTNAINSLSYNAKEKYQRAIFIHLDSRSKKQQLDVFFYHQNGQNNKTKSKQLADTMLKTFRDRYKEKQPTRGFSGTVSTRPLYVLKNTTPVSIFVELANMQNTNDQKRYLDYDNREALAKWLCMGFIKDYQSASR